MENKVERRWGIVAVAVAMFFVVMINASMSGQKNSIYYAVWIAVGYYGYKGNLEQIKSLMKFLIALNLLIMLAVTLFINDDMLSYVYKNGTKEGLVISVLIMLVPKIALIFYCNKKIKNEQLSFSQIPIMTSVAMSNQNNVVISEKIYADAITEFESTERKKGLYAKLLVENNGEETKVKAQYIKKRTEELKAEEEIKNKEIEKINDYKKSSKFYLKEKKFILGNVNGIECLVLENGMGVVVTKTRDYRVYKNEEAMTKSALNFKTSGMYLEDGYVESYERNEIIN
jgi:hypothetical protein